MRGEKRNVQLSDEKDLLSTHIAPRRFTGHVYLAVRCGKIVAGLEADPDRWYTARPREHDRRHAAA